MPDHPVIWMSAYYGNGYVVEGQCATLGCTKFHLHGGRDENGWPKVKYKTHAEAFLVAHRANQENANE